MSTQVNEDDSVVNRYFLAVDSSIYEPGMFDEIKEAAIDIGATVEDYSSEERVGLIVTESFKDLNELAATYPTYDIDPTPRFFGVRVKRTSTLLKRRYFIEFQIDTQQLREGGIFDSRAIQSMAFRHSVTLPGTISNHNGTQVADNKVSWEMDAASGSTYVLKAESELGTELPIDPLSGIAILGTCGVIALVTSGVGIAVSLRQRGDISRR